MEKLNNIAVRQEGQAAIVTIDRATKLNVLNRETLEELCQVLNLLESDDNVRGIVLTGSGEKAFAAGADIKEFEGLSVDDAKQVARYGHIHIMDRIQNFTKPIVAAVNGFALGGGLELAMACHLRIASASAKFGLPEVSLGIIPGYGGTQRLPRLVGRGRALQMIMTGEMIDSATALRWGLVNDVVTPEKLMDTCLALLATVFTRSRQAITHAIAAVQTGIENPKAGQQLEIELFGESFATTDCREGIQAFLEKRKPNF